MFPKNNTPILIFRWLRIRGYRLWVRYPMVAVLGIALAAIAAQNAFGNAWCNVLFACLLVLAVLALLQTRVRPQTTWVWPQLCIGVSMALFFSFYHSMSQSDAKLQLDSWDESIKEFSKSDRLATVSWNPIACRGIIDSGFRYRKATLPGKTAEPDDVDWQSFQLTCKSFHTAFKRLE